MLIGTDNPGSPNIQARPQARLPIVTTVGKVPLGYTQSFNRFEITTKGMVDRSVYQESSLTDGSTSSNDDRNFNQYGTTLRGSYDLKPGIKPFVEADIDTRVHDLAFDRNGQQREFQRYRCPHRHDVRADAQARLAKFRPATSTVRYARIRPCRRYPGPRRRCVR